MLLESHLQNIPLRQLNDSAMDLHPRYNGTPIYLSRVCEFDPSMAQATYPNRHTFYEILWTTSGQGMHYIDFKGYEVKPHCFYFVTPGQIHFWNLTIPLEGIFIMFDPDFFHLRHADPNFMYQFDFFNRTDSSAALRINNNRATYYNELIETLYKEFRQPHPGQDTILSGYLQVLLMQIQRDYVGFNRESTRTSPAVIANQFQNLLSENYQIYQNVDEYAKMLHISPSYLSRTIKHHTGLTASELIRQRIVLSAKRLLVHTSQTVAEIACELNFTDPSYFSKFFRRETDMSPVSFRRNFTAKIPH